MAERPSSGFGAKLREARERRGVTLREIANATKISVSVLEALERNDVSRLPGGIFSRGFVRSYAVEVGLDPEETIRDFVTQFPQETITAGHPASERLDDHDAENPERRLASPHVWLALMGVSIVAAVIYFSVTAGRDAAPAALPSVAVTRPTAGTPAPPVLLPVTGEAETPPAGDAPAASEPDPPPSVVSPVADADVPGRERLTIRVVASRSCWVATRSDGLPRVVRTLRPGEEHQLDVVTELVLTVGDAGALKLTINAAEAKPLGRAGQVVTVRINQGNYRTYLGG